MSGRLQSALAAPLEYGGGYIIQHLPQISKLPDGIELAGALLARKTQLHISLVAVKKIVPALALKNRLEHEAAEAEVEEAVAEVLEAVKPQFVGYRPELRITERADENRVTVIAMAQVDHLDEVFEGINRRLGLEVPLQPAHVTLFTKPADTAIGVTSPAELKQLTRLPTTDEAAIIDPLKDLLA